MPRGTRRRRLPWRCRCHRVRGGQALAETAVVIPVLLLLVFGIVELANAWRTFQVVTNVAREGARVAVLPTSQEADVRARIEGGLEANGLADGDVVVTIECNGSAGTCAGPGSTGSEVRIRIEVPYSFALLRPFVRLACGGGCAGDFGDIMVASTAIMRHE